MSSLVNRREHGQIVFENCITQLCESQIVRTNLICALPAQRTKQQANVIRPRCSARRTVGENDAASFGEDSSKTATAIPTVRTARSIEGIRQIDSWLPAFLSGLCRRTAFQLSL